jgi:hypothetical protein
MGAIVCATADARTSGGPAVDSAEQRLLTRGLCVEADPTAGPRFRTAAVRLDEAGPDIASRPLEAAEAARLLLGLALGGATDELSELLVPDPAVSENRWTVWCFEIGGLAPVAIQDFDDPVEALVTMSACPDAEHVGAELVASNAQGLHWRAVWRADDHVSFQLPSAETTEADDETEEGEHAEELLAALGRWRTRLDEWSDRDATVAAEEEPHAASTAAPTLPMQLHLDGIPAPEPHATPKRTTSTPAGVIAPSRAAAAQLQALEQRLSGIESTLNIVSTELRALALDAERQGDASATAVEHAIDLRFKVLSRVMQSALDRLGAQVADEMQEIRSSSPLQLVDPPKSGLASGLASARPVS